MMFSFQYQKGGFTQVVKSTLEEERLHIYFPSAGTYKFSSNFEISTVTNGTPKSNH